MKRGDTRIQPGDFPLSLSFYRVTDGNSKGAIARPAVFAYKLYGRSDPNEVGMRRADLTMIDETWTLISIPYFASRVPEIAMLVEIGGEPGQWEIRGVVHVKTSARKIELSCRLVR
jgi:hypothetical protein